MPLWKIFRAKSKKRMKGTNIKKLKKLFLNLIVAFRNAREQSKSKRKYQEKIRAHLVKCLKMDVTIKKSIIAIFLKKIINYIILNRFISTFSSIWSPIFFIRYLIIISQLCTVVFQLQFVWAKSQTIKIWF